uniref:Uncharacterized protein n=1 Tax=Rangifer tarandus platyrhynchus TaxID=3082113 RepID=A0ACB0EMT2_RANTA|nr:unnamed protein product [Rangifer tarandus platyrhynchus]
MEKSRMNVPKGPDTLCFDKDEFMKVIPSVEKIEKILNSQHSKETSALEASSLDKSSMMGSLSSSFNPFSSIDKAMASSAGLCGQRWWRWLFLLRDCSGI